MYDAIRATDSYHAIGDTVKTVHLGAEQGKAAMFWLVDSIVEDSGDIRIWVRKYTKTTQDSGETHTTEGSRSIWAEIPRESVVALYRQLD